jgi:DNA recombination protein RmuC
VPVDAKFPLEDFRRLLQAATDDERARARSARSASACGSTSTTSRPSTSGRTRARTTSRSCTCPAENVYYETIVRDDDAERALGAYALERQVVPVSPNSFYAYLQAIVLGSAASASRRAPRR